MENAARKRCKPSTGRNLRETDSVQDKDDDSGVFGILLSEFCAWIIQCLDGGGQLELHEKV